MPRSAENAEKVSVRPSQEPRAMTSFEYEAVVRYFASPCDLEMASLLNEWQYNQVLEIVEQREEACPF